MGICTFFNSTRVCVATTKLILRDGRLQEFHYPVKVSYVLQMNPMCFLCNADEMDSTTPYVGYGENVNLTLSSSTESPKEPEEIKETPTSGTKGRKGKNPVEASLTECGDKVASFLPFLEIFYDTTLSFSGSRYATGNTFVEQIYDIGYTIDHYVDDLQLNDGLRSMARQMKLKFNKYWANVNNLNVFMFISLVLDLKHKLRYVE
ncbi:hypothetical protein V6N11_075466 [Hibiscus sabdariffa]|uniref:hAT-like transposase RNase-H fold domain-containing protein n=1 Tax=Hibiscus sabdariffa TaxID=183260 RepID=A0ABR2R6K2_9ROSI